MGFRMVWGVPLFGGVEGVFEGFGFRFQILKGFWVGGPATHPTLTTL